MQENLLEKEASEGNLPGKGNDTQPEDVATIISQYQVKMNNDRIAKAHIESSCPELTERRYEYETVFFHGQEIRYCSNLEAWFYWDGWEWVRDDKGYISPEAKETFRYVYPTRIEG